jgi:hypothetical protein
MSISGNIKRIAETYDRAFPDTNIITNIVEICSELINNKHSPTEKLTYFWTAGDIVSCKGWQVDPGMIEHLISAFQGRAIRHTVIMITGSSFEEIAGHPKFASWFLSTNKQTQRCILPIIKKNEELYGKSLPITIEDWERLDALIETAFHSKH